MEYSMSQILGSQMVNLKNLKLSDYLFVMNGLYFVFSFRSILKCMRLERWRIPCILSLFWDVIINGLFGLNFLQAFWRFFGKKKRTAVIYFAYAILSSQVIRSLGAFCIWIIDLKYIIILTQVKGKHFAKVRREELIQRWFW